MRKVPNLALASVLAAGISAAGLTTAFAEGAENQPRPILNEFIQTALIDHPQLAAAEADLSAARARARGQSRPLYNPEVEFDYEDGDVVTKQIGLAQTFDWSGKRRARYGAATAEIELAEARYLTSRKALLSALLASLSDYNTFLKALQIADRRVELSAEFLQLAERRNKAGDIPRSEMLTARLALAEAKAARNEAQSDLSMAKEQLVAIAGGDHALWPMLEGVPARVSATLDPSMIQELLRNLPELEVASQQTQISRTRIKVAQKERNPDPTVGVRYGEEGSSTLVGVSLSIPIPVLNNYKDGVDEARAGLVGSEQSYLDARRRAEARLTASYDRYKMSLDNWLDWQGEVQQLLFEQRHLIQRLWKLGEITAPDYLVQLNQTFTTERASAELHGRLWKDWFQWLDASGATVEWTENLQ